MITEIVSAFDTQIQTVWDGAVAWDGVPYQAESGTPYIDVSMAAQDQLVAGVGPGTFIRWSGIYTIVIYRPFGEGVQEGLNWAQIIRAAFPRGSQFPVSNTGAIVEKTVIEKATNNGVFTSIPVMIFWFATEVPS